MLASLLRGVHYIYSIGKMYIGIAYSNTIDKCPGRSSLTEKSALRCRWTITTSVL